MGIITFGLTAPGMPTIGTIPLEADTRDEDDNTLITAVNSVGSLQHVITEAGEEDLRFETGVIGWVARPHDYRDIIHVAYDRDALIAYNDEGEPTASVPENSVRTASTLEIGMLGIATPIKRDAQGKIKPYNLFFAVTAREVTNMTRKSGQAITIELYRGVA